MDKTFSRRAIVKGGLIAGAVIPVLGLMTNSAFAADPTPLDPNDPVAKSLGFVNDSTKVNAAANPAHTAAQKCSTCAQYVGKPGDARGPCNVFIGHTVPQGGWCKAWAKKPGT